MFIGLYRDKHTNFKQINHHGTDTSKNWRNNDRKCRLLSKLYLIAIFPFHHRVSVLLQVSSTFLMNLQYLNIMKEKIQQKASHSAIYGLGWMGAVVYYISTATGFWMGVFGFLKALVWPAFLVYEALKALRA